MAISELTKRIASGKRAELRQKREKNISAIQAHRDAIDKLRAINDNIKLEIDSLVADIPEPVPAPEEV